MFDFDKVIDRRGTGGEKWDKYQGQDVIPMWVADMDFQVPPAVTKALQERVHHGIYGYPGRDYALEAVVVKRLKRCFGWEINPDWIVWLPGLVSGINAMCHAFSDPGDDIMTTIPVYPPFLAAPGNAGKNCIKVPMVLENDRYVLDFKGIKEAITHKTRIFILCSPYNPCGTIFTKEELGRLVSICHAHNILLLSDEIHADFILDDDAAHCPTWMCDPKAPDNTITLMAPSKTFNIPGLSCSFGVISNGALRQKFQTFSRGLLPHVNCMGLLAARAAFESGDQWLAALIQYLKTNRDYVYQRINNMPGLSMKAVSSTYLAWIDAKNLKVENPARYFESMGVGLNDGATFGAKGYVRLNFGCPMATLKQGLDRMEKAVDMLFHSSVKDS
ncbi:cystathione beta-lyase [Desulfocicer vacuolatum DSM 3385]|uniref:cysteine-S-conjugate beta-lyase n=1 Tax=Desulfocicer vacuolatum DSM 3385 TaxID=1121400 RepID=A0A1W2BGC6_9BACT|nr:PatB family C-S lyase [Desulfocicer vacuolatum]SMC72015.1 cystathione beta-lyase [Desulfocicer vacuolatum DSM 3385]